jgi:regulator of protease activity HflC (stomatin/prohibitin superfamily)
MTLVVRLGQPVQTVTQLGLHFKMPLIDREVTVLVAEATSEAERNRGEGDGKRNRIFAGALDPNFLPSIDQCRHI